MTTGQFSHCWTDPLLHTTMRGHTPVARTVGRDGACPQEPRHPNAVRCNLISGLDHNSAHLFRPLGCRPLAEHGVARANPRQRSGLRRIFDRGLISLAATQGSIRSLNLKVSIGEHHVGYPELGQQAAAQSLVP